MNGASTQLLQLEQSLKESIRKPLTRKHVVKLRELDQGVVGFIEHVRHSMEWEDKKLGPADIEVFFSILDSEHDCIIRGIEELVKEI